MLTPEGRLVQRQSVRQLVLGAEALDGGCTALQSQLIEQGAQVKTVGIHGALLVITGRVNQNRSTQSL